MGYFSMEHPRLTGHFPAEINNLTSKRTMTPVTALPNHIDNHPQLKGRWTVQANSSPNEHGNRSDTIGFLLFRPASRVKRHRVHLPRDDHG